MDSTTAYYTDANIPGDDDSDYERLQKHMRAQQAAAAKYREGTAEWHADQRAAFDQIRARVDRAKGACPVCKDYDLLVYGNRDNSTDFQSLGQMSEDEMLLSVSGYRDAGVSQHIIDRHPEFLAQLRQKRNLEKRHINDIEAMRHLLREAYKIQNQIKALDRIIAAAEKKNPELIKVREEELKNNNALLPY